MAEAPAGGPPPSAAEARPRRRPGFFEHLHPPTIPRREARFSYTFGLGGISLFLFLSLIATGALELFYFEPSPEGANASVQRIAHLVPYGWLVRGIHYWAGQAMIVTAALHLIRVVLTGGYKAPRRFNWLLGVALLASTLLLDFTGLVLRWDEHIAWALMVGTNLLRTIPVIGEALYLAAVGGTEIGAATVVRFFGWHVFGLVLPACVLIVWHLFRVRRDGGISHRQPAAAGRSPSAEERLPRAELVRREALAALICSVVLIALALLFPPGLEGRADFANLPADADAPWFFLWVQQLLHRGDPLLTGVVIPVAILLLLCLVPFGLDRDSTQAGIWFNRKGRLAQAAVLGCFGLILILIIKGALS